MLVIGLGGRAVNPCTPPQPVAISAATQASRRMAGEGGTVKLFDRAIRPMACGPGEGRRAAG